MDTEVESDRYFSWEDLLDKQTSNLSGYVTSHIQLEKLILEYECKTSSRFRSLKCTKDFGKNIDLSSIKTLNVRFSDTQANCDPLIPYDGTPFLIVGKKILECHQGPDRDKKTNGKKLQRFKGNSDHTYNVKRRNMLQPSKKKGCPAKVKIRHVLKFPGYQLAENENYKYQRNKATAQLKEDLKNQIHDVMYEHRFYISFPENDDHCNHLKGEASCTLQSMDRRLSDYIKKVVMEHGVTSTLKMKLLLEVYLKEFIFKDTPLPPKYNKRFWPSLKDIYNHMGSQLLKLRDSCIDQEIIQEMVTKENLYHPDDKFYIRTKNEESESVIEEPDESLLLDEDFTIRQTGCRNKFLYVHQTKWQQELLRRYGNEMCLLDATYRTTRYSLPLYFLCVPTNVNYMTVATFIVECEDTPSIQEALSVLKAWNLAWRPTYFMCDYSNQEINAIETVFPESFVYLCDFHREQSWDRWLKASHNCIGNDKPEILNLFRSIAHANTIEEFNTAKSTLEESRFWTDNSRLRNWFKDRWLDKHKRWVQAFRQTRFNASVNTSNGVERQNKSLKYEFLETKKAKSLSHLLTILWNEFLPAIYQRYVRQNLSSAEEARNYAENIPGFLVNRPGSVVKHCYRRWEDSVNISVDDIDQIGEGLFLVKSQTPGCSQVYTVNFLPGDFPIPSCSCDDWRKHHLICKHFCAIFRHTPWKWEQLPEEYRKNPFITLDDDVLHHFCSPVNMCTSSPVNTCTRNSEPCQESDSSLKGSQPLPVPSTSRVSKLRSKILSICEAIKSHVYSCKDEVQLEEFYNKLQNTAETLRDVSCDKNEFLVDNEKDMTHIGTPKARRLSLSKKRRKGKGRHGLAADRLKTHSSKGIGDLLKRESDKCKVIEEEVITVDDNDECVFNTISAVKSILKKEGESNSSSSIKKRVHFSDTCSSYQQEDISHALQEVGKLWSLERGTGYIVGKVSDFNVTDTDIRSLYGRRWVTDQVVDAYLANIVQRELKKGKSLSLYPSQTMKSVVEGTYPVDKCRKKLKLWEYSTIIGAVCQNNHWTILIINPKERIVTFINPKGERESELNEIKKNWCAFIKARKEVYNEAEAEIGSWSVQTLQHSKQIDAFNCGVYCLIFADRYFLKEPLTDITDKSLSTARKDIAASLMMCNAWQAEYCPTCGFSTDKEELVRCKNCSKQFHNTEACVGPLTNRTFTCQICSNKPVEKTKRKLKTYDDQVEEIQNGKKRKPSSIEKVEENDEIQIHDISKTESTTARSHVSVSTDRKDKDHSVELLWSMNKDFYIPVAKVCGKLVMDEDIRSLRDNECLTDRVLDCYLSQLVSCHNDFGRKVIYFNQTKMTGIINGTYQIPEVFDCSDVDFEADVILGIYHRSHHWTLVVVEVKRGIIYFYNPCGERRTEMRKIVNSWRKFEMDYREKFDVQTKVSDWKITSTPHANQKDVFNCGIFCLMFAEKHLAGDFNSLLTITSANLKQMRRVVACKLMESKVFLKDCCPKCAKDIGDDESIQCKACRRSFHFKPFCIEEDLADIKETEYFECRLCKINFWKPEDGCLYDLRKDPKKIWFKKFDRNCQG